MRIRFTHLLLTLTVLVIFSCGGDNSTSNDRGSSVVTISIQDSFFEPKSITITAGTTVRWVLRGTMADHTVTENSGAFDSGFRFRNSGDQFERTFTSSDEGRLFLYHCESHWISDEMQGSIRVGNAPGPPPRY
jgi:plastocyanin